MEPNRRIKPKKTKSVAGVSSQKTTPSDDHSNDRASRPPVKKGSSVVTPPMSPPRLRSRSGGTIVKTSGKQKPKR